MPILYTTKGDPISVPAENVQAAWASGEFGLPQNKPVNVVVPPGFEGMEEGKVVGVDVKHLGKFLQAGFRIEEDEERAVRKYGDWDITAAGLGVLQGLTIGLAKGALAKAGVFDEQEMNELLQANPISAGLGEAAGLIGPALIPGAQEVAAVRGLGLAAKAGRALTSVGRLTPAYAISRIGLTKAAAMEQALLKTLTSGAPQAAGVLTAAATRGIAHAAGGALEGALYGAGHMISEAALGDTMTVSEALTAHVGSGLMWGAAGGAVFGVGSKLFGAGYGKFKGWKESHLAKMDPILKEKNAFLIDNTLQTALKASKQQYSKLQRSGRLDDIKELIVSEDAIPPGLLSPTDPGGGIIRASTKEVPWTNEKVVESMVEGIKYHGMMRGDVGIGMDEIIGVLERIGMEESTIRQFRPDPDRILNVIKKNIRETAVKGTKEKASDVGDLEFAKQAIEDLIKGGRNQFTFKTLVSLKNQYSEVFKKPHYKPLWRAAQDEIDEKVQSLLTFMADRPGTIPEWETIYKAFPNTIQQATKGLTSRREILRAMRDGFARSKRFYWAFHDLLEMGENEALVGKALKDEMEGAIKQFFSIAAGRTLLWGLSPVRAAASAGGVVGGKKLAGMALERFRKGPGTAADQYLRLIGTKEGQHNIKLGWLSKVVDQVQGNINEAVDIGLQTGKAKRGKPSIGVASAFLMKQMGVRDRNEAIEKYSEYLKRASTDPSQVANAISANLSDLEGVAPNVAAGMAQMMAATFQTGYLATPKLVRGPTLQPALDKPKYSIREVKRVEDTAFALYNPLEAIKLLMGGQGSKVMMTVVKTTYPRLWEATKMQAAIRAAESKSPLTYQQKLKLAAVFNQPTDISTKGRFLRESVNVHRPPTPEQGPPPKKSGDRRQRSVENAKRSMQSRYQQTEVIS